VCVLGFAGGIGVSGGGGSHVGNGRTVVDIMMVIVVVSV
jgi:hypothetical protein